MEIIGYSERGMLNSLFYEISRKSKPEKLLSDIFKINIDECKKIFVEHSLSDFGDPDTVILGKNANKKIVVFVEAKISERGKFTLSVQSKKIVGEFDKFEKGAKNFNRKQKKDFTSNLFTQLYHKFAFVKELLEIIRKDWDKLSDNDKKELINKIELTVCEKVFKTGEKASRKIGNNEVVHKTVLEISEYIKYADVYYVGIIPARCKSSPDNRTWLKNNFTKKELNALPDWIEFQKHCSFVYWEDIRSICYSKAELKKIKEVFEFNGEQICLREP